MNKRRNIRRSGLVWTVLPDEGVEIPAREVEVDKEWFVSPRHINRIDIDRKNTHGWQVRYQGESSFFSDNKAKNGEKEASLESAKAYLQSIYKNDKHKTKFLKPSLEHRDKYMKLYSGVSGLWRRATSKGIYEFYFQVIAPIYGKSHKNIKVYTCTENTLNKELINKRAAMSIAMRRYFEELYRNANTEEAEKLTYKSFFDIDLKPFERKFPTITNKKLKEMLEKAKKKWG